MNEMPDTYEITWIGSANDKITATMTAIPDVTASARIEEAVTNRGCLKFAPRQSVVSIVLSPSSARRMIENVERKVTSGFVFPLLASRDARMF